VRALAPSLAPSLALSLLLAAPQALAETPLSADAFDVLTQGRTMTWAEYGQVYGVEQYLPDRRVRWTVLGDDCITGHWYAEGPAICFQYDDRPDPACWTFTQGPTGLLARHTSGPAKAEPVVIQETFEPMACFGPRVGA
jgi:hypothetical protein